MVWLCFDICRSNQISFGRNQNFCCLPLKPGIYFRFKFKSKSIEWEIQRLAAKTLNSLLAASFCFMIPPIHRKAPELYTKLIWHLHCPTYLVFFAMNYRNRIRPCHFARQANFLKTINLTSGGRSPFYGAVTALGGSNGPG